MAGMKSFRYFPLIAARCTVAFTSLTKSGLADNPRAAKSHINRTESTIIMRHYSGFTARIGYVLAGRLAVPAQIIDNERRRPRTKAGSVIFGVAFYYLHRLIAQRKEIELFHYELSRCSCSLRAFLARRISAAWRLLAAVQPHFGEQYLCQNIPGSNSARHCGRRHFLVFFFAILCYLLY
jgi:hypothetical protein